MIATMAPQQEGLMKQQQAPLTAWEQKLVCIVPGCGVDLTDSTHYLRRHKVCQTHLKALSVPLDGTDCRFCQQCGRFQPLAEFRGERKSCEVALQAHNARRRVKRDSSVGGWCDRRSGRGSKRTLLAAGDDPSSSEDGTVGVARKAAPRKSSSHRSSGGKPGAAAAAATANTLSDSGGRGGCGLASEGVEQDGPCSRSPNCSSGSPPSLDQQQPCISYVQQLYARLMPTSRHGTPAELDQQQQQLYAAAACPPEYASGGLQASHHPMYMANAGCSGSNFSAAAAAAAAAAAGTAGAVTTLGLPCGSMVVPGGAYQASNCCGPQFHQQGQQQLLVEHHAPYPQQRQQQHHMAPPSGMAGSSSSIFSQLAPQQPQHKALPAAGSLASWMTDEPLRHQQQRLLQQHMGGAAPPAAARLAAPDAFQSKLVLGGLSPVMQVQYQQQQQHHEQLLQWQQQAQQQQQQFKMDAPHAPQQQQQPAAAWDAVPAGPACKASSPQRSGCSMSSGNSSGAATATAADAAAPAPNAATVSAAAPGAAAAAADAEADELLEHTLDLLLASYPDWQMLDAAATTAGEGASVGGGTCCHPSSGTATPAAGTAAATASSPASSNVAVNALSGPLSVPSLPSGTLSLLDGQPGDFSMPLLAPDVLSLNSMDAWGGSEFEHAPAAAGGVAVPAATAAAPPPPRMSSELPSSGVLHMLPNSSSAAAAAPARADSDAFAGLLAAPLPAASGAAAACGPDGVLAGQALLAPGSSMMLTPGSSCVPLSQAALDLAAMQDQHMWCMPVGAAPPMRPQHTAPVYPGSGYMPPQPQPSLSISTAPGDAAAAAAAPNPEWQQLLHQRRTQLAHLQQQLTSVSHHSQQLVRLSIKLHGVTPDRLPNTTVLAMERLLLHNTADMEAMLLHPSFRQGCIQMEIDVLVRVERQAQATSSSGGGGKAAADTAAAAQQQQQHDDAPHAAADGKAAVADGGLFVAGHRDRRAVAAAEAKLRSAVPFAALVRVLLQLAGAGGPGDAPGVRAIHAQVGSCMGVWRCDAGLVQDWSVDAPEAPRGCWRPRLLAVDAATGPALAEDAAAGSGGSVLQVMQLDVEVAAGMLARGSASASALDVWCTQRGQFLPVMCQPPVQQPRDSLLLQALAGCPGAAPGLILLEVEQELALPRAGSPQEGPDPLTCKSELLPIISCSSPAMAGEVASKVLTLQDSQQRAELLLQLGMLLDCGVMLQQFHAHQALLPAARHEWLLQQLGSALYGRTIKTMGTKLLLFCSLADMPGTGTHVAGVLRALQLTSQLQGLPALASPQQHLHAAAHAAPSQQQEQEEEVQHAAAASTDHVQQEDEEEEAHAAAEPASAPAVPAEAAAARDAPAVAPVLASQEEVAAAAARRGVPSVHDWQFEDVDCRKGGSSGSATGSSAQAAWAAAAGSPAGKGKAAPGSPAAALQGGGAIAASADGGDEAESPVAILRGALQMVAVLTLMYVVLEVAAAVYKGQSPVAQLLGTLAQLRHIAAIMLMPLAMMALGLLLAVAQFGVTSPPLRARGAGGLSGLSTGATEGKVKATAAGQAAGPAAGPSSARTAGAA